MEDTVDAPSDDVERSDTHWALFGSQWPKSEIVFFCQVVILYTVVVVSIYNLTKGSGNSSCLGYLLPSPSMKRDDHGV